MTVQVRDHDKVMEPYRTGEAEGLKVSLAGAIQKLAQTDATAARRSETAGLGIPAYRDIAAATITAPGNRP